MSQAPKVVKEWNIAVLCVNRSVKLISEDIGQHKGGIPTSRSLPNNISQLGSRGLLGMSHGGIPVGARQRIEELFGQVVRGECVAYELEQELNHWGAFEEYQDRFFALFKKQR